MQNPNNMENVFDRMGIHDVVAPEAVLAFLSDDRYCRSLSENFPRLVAFHAISL
jgi:hypothetical protein